MTTTTNSPLGVVQRIDAAFAARDLDALVDLVDADVVITQDPARPWGGRYEGPDGVARFVNTLIGTIDSTVTPGALFQAGDTVVQYGRTAGRVRSNGASFDVPECHVSTIRDDRVVRAEFYIDSTAMLEALRG